MRQASRSLEAMEIANDAMESGAKQASLEAGLEAMESAAKERLG